MSIPEGKINYKIISLREEHLPQIMHLQEIILAGLEDQDHYFPVTMESIKIQMKTLGSIMGVVANHKVMAYHALYFPQKDESDCNFGIDINLATNAMQKSVNVQVVLVHPDFRGNNVGYALNMTALQHLRKQKYHHVFATVAPGNISSLKLFFRCGFIIKSLKYKYGGKLRYIVHLDLDNPEINYKAIHYRIVARNAVETQQKLIKDGYYGIKLTDEFQIMYNKN